MKKYFAVPLLLLLIAGTVRAADIDRLPQGKVVFPLPGLIILHDMWGLDSFTKREAEKLAELGFWVVGVDLASGQLPNDASSAERLKNNLDTQEALKRIDKNYHKMISNKRIDKTRMGILGWGMGARLALRYATQNPDLRTIVSLYGEPLADEALLKNIKAKGFAIFAELDQQIPQSKIDLFKKNINKNNLIFDVKMVKGVKPGFLDFTRTASFNPKAAEEVRPQIHSFLQKYLSLTEYKKW